ncbi:hypothetical protein [Cellulomonas iranensis]|nr:hypothetical protein [Cellulomonas iranensis]
MRTLTKIRTALTALAARRALSRAQDDALLDVAHRAALAEGVAR